MNTLYIARRRRTIGLTSLVDVVFILLLFFMLTTSFIKQEEIKLSIPSTGVSLDSDVPQKLVLLDTGNLVEWGRNKLLTDQDLLQLFNLQQPLIISVSDELVVQDIVGALVRLDELGFNLVSLGPLWMTK